jgi:RHS repeat-associated protein
VAQTRFGYDGDQVWADLSGTNGLQTRYLRGDAVDQLFARIGSTGLASWYLTDWEGSVRKLTDGAGALVDTIVYDGYGNILSETSASSGGDYKFDGMRTDAETGDLSTWWRTGAPPIGRWMQQDPAGLGSDGPNPYRLADDKPTSATDPTGLSAIETEGEARSILKTEMARWQGRGYNFAAHLLQYFLDKKGPKPYVLTKADTDEVIRESDRLVRQVIYQAIWDDSTIRCGNLQGASISFDGKVRWLAEGVGESFWGSLYTSDEQFRDANNHLFYAYGGAEMKLRGLILNVRTVNNGGRIHLKFDVKAKVTISDDYSFAPEGKWGSRLWVDQYKAANFLETRLPRGRQYKPFRNTVTFKKTYTGFRSDRIMGFAFHTQRPFRPGEPIPPPYKAP